MTERMRGWGWSGSTAGAAGLLAGLWLLGAPNAMAQTGGLYPGDPVAGRRLFVERDCVRCHSIWGNGGTLGPDFALVGAGRSLHQLAGLFWNHTPRMIETVQDKGFDWPVFTESQLADIISYIYYVKLFDRPGDPERGERWFREKQCLACHVVGPEARRGRMSLDGYARYIAPIALAQGMWNAGPAMRSAQTARGIAMPVFVAGELADIHAYIRRASTLRERHPVFLQPPDPGTGRRLYATKGCARCHGPEGGGTGFGPNLRAATESLGVSEIAGALWNHSFQMAAAMRSRGIAFPKFDGAEMADLIAFLYYMRFYESGGDARTGELLFVRKRCINCHAHEGRPTLGPDLALSTIVLTPLGLATAMWNHAPAMYSLVQLEHRDWPRFEGEEMRDLSEYLRELATSEQGGP